MNLVASIFLSLNKHALKPDNGTFASKFEIFFRKYKLFYAFTSANPYRFSVKNTVNTE